MILTWARGHTYFWEERSHFLHTSFHSIFIIIIICLFLPLITSSGKLADVKPELPTGLHASHSSRYPKWFRSSLISLWIICLLQKKEQMCRNSDRDTVIIIFLFYRREGWLCALAWVGEREVYVQQNSRNLKHRYQIGYVNSVWKFPSDNISFWMI